MKFAYCAGYDYLKNKNQVWLYIINYDNIIHPKSHNCQQVNRQYISPKQGAYSYCHRHIGCQISIENIEYSAWNYNQNTK